MLAAWVRDRLWRADSWCPELASLRHAVAAEPRGAKTPERLFDLAQATEQCDPDRGHALARYLEAWRGGHAGACEAARVLAIRLRAHLTVAEIATTDGDLVAAGAAFLDAGFPELAVGPLQQFATTRSPASSAGAESVGALLALAQGKRFDAEREISESSCVHNARQARPPRRPTCTPRGSRAWQISGSVAPR